MTTTEFNLAFPENRAHQLRMKACIVVAAVALLGTANGATLVPIRGSTTDPIGDGAIANVIDGVVDVDSFLQLGPTASGPFGGPYSVRFDLGGSFELTGMNLWNNAGVIESDGEGVNSFMLIFRNTSLSSVGTFSSSANDLLAPQAFGFSASDVAFVDFAINGNHQENGPKVYVDFYEINFTAVPEPSSVSLSIVGTILGLRCVKRRSEIRSA